MFEILFNDSFSTLMFIANYTDETFLIIDNKLNKYFELSFAPFEPENEDLMDAWKDAINKYYELENKEHELHDWRMKMAKSSLDAFGKYINKNKGE